ncbi:MAG: hypothetical protein ACM3SP_26685 [Chloroflexota bacterium]
MKRIGSFLSVLALSGVVSVTSAAAAKGLLLKQKAAPNSYCHIKFPAIRPSTLAGDHPMLKRATTGDVIDFYGACDENPVGRDQVASQRMEYSQQLDVAYSD